MGSRYFCCKLNIDILQSLFIVLYTGLILMRIKNILKTNLKWNVLNKTIFLSIQSCTVRWRPVLLDNFNMRKTHKLKWKQISYHWLVIFISLWTCALCLHCRNRNTGVETETRKCWEWPRSSAAEIKVSL